MLTDRPDRIGRLERAATAGVILLAAGSFVLSYDALHQLAVTNHVPKPLAWIWPLIVDGFIITASLAVLHAILTGRSASYPWLLVLAFSTTSVVFNVLHAPPALVARLVAAIPPLTLVLSFELLMRQLRHRLAPPRPYVEVSIEASPLVPSTIPRGDQATTQPVRTTLRDEARELKVANEKAGQRLTGKSLATILGISDGYARRLLREITVEHIST